MSSSQPTTRPSLQLVMSSLLRADFAVLMKNQRALLISLFLPLVILFSTNSSKATNIRWIAVHHRTGDPLRTRVQLDPGLRAHGGPRP